jgi:HlyD family secretion protein
MHTYSPAGFGYWQSYKLRLQVGLSMANGRLEATEVHFASKTPGRLADVLVNEGDRVSKNQLLARLDTRTLEARRHQAEAEALRATETLAEAEAEANVQFLLSEQRLAKQELKRTSQLFQRHYASRQLFEQQQSRLETNSVAVHATQSQVGALRAAIGAAEAQVGATVQRN